MTTREAIGVVAKQLTDELVICTTGYTCRDMQAACDRPGNFYMIGSMGLAASLGLGIALSRPQRKVVVLDGDGSVLMGLGMLPMIGSTCPRNLIHLALDNEGFVSTGGQPTCSSQIPLEGIAHACGYSVAERVDSPDEILSAWSSMGQRPGPAFLLIKCRPDVGSPRERIRLGPEAIAERFMKAVAPPLRIQRRRTAQREGSVGVRKRRRLCPPKFVGGHSDPTLSEDGLPYEAGRGHGTGGAG